MYSALKALVDLKEWKNVHDSTYTLIETLYGQRQNMPRAGFKFKKNGSRRICAIFLIGMQFMIIATMSAKGYGLSRYGSSIDILVYFSIISIIISLFLVPARKGVSGTLIK
jgi:hypothetical protein